MRASMVFVLAFFASSSSAQCPDGTTNYSNCGKWVAVQDCPSPTGASCPNGGWPYDVQAVHAVLNPSTRISYVVQKDGPVRLRIVDVAGRHVATLVEAVRPPGTHVVEWNGRDDQGRSVAAGAYFSRLETAGGGGTGKLVVVE